MSANITPSLLQPQDSGFTIDSAVESDGSINGLEPGLAEYLAMSTNRVMSSRRSGRASAKHVPVKLTSKATAKRKQLIDSVPKPVGKTIYQ